MTATTNPTFSFDGAEISIADIQKLMEGLEDIAEIMRLHDNHVYSKRLKLASSLIRQMAWHIWGDAWKDRPR